MALENTRTAEVVVSNLTNKVNQRQLAWIRGQYEKVVRQCKKAGVTPPTMSSRFLGYEVGYNEVGCKQATATYEVTLDGAVQLTSSPYRFVGKVEYANGVNMIHVRDEEIAERCEVFRRSADHCDHCNKVRRRTATFILLDTRTDELVRVGKACMKDVVGADSAAEALLACNFMNILSVTPSDADLDDYIGRMKPPRDFDTLHLVSLAYAVCQLDDGYIPASADEGSTKSQVLEVLREMYSRDPSVDKIVGVAADKFEIAKEALEWIRSMPDNKIVGYIGNLYAAVSEDRCLTKHVGIAVSLVSAYSRATSEKAAPKAEEKPSAWIGSVGERLRDLELVYIASNSYEGHYGTTWFHKFRTEDGNDVTVKASKGLWGLFRKDDMKGGTKCLLKAGTVVKHDSYRERKSTTLNRAVFATL